MATYSHESEMALFSECMLPCARKVLDSVSIVRDACLHLYFRSCVFAAFQLRGESSSFGNLFKP
jgi:hypothetical protein